MAKTQMNVRVDETTAQAARERALARGVSVNRYIEELVQRDAAEVGRSFVDAAADFMKSYESVFADEFEALEAGGLPGGKGTGGLPTA
ncbi:toxin-antitoxin system HicB family antitoxin [Streptomyces reniochalinae]|uniref:toxin-antitoxin system HicB family antitoxin n=1 Tax=Streptomyces reniochalinae TaxID=2250578 RepID=UPI001FE96851|nr:toxin-antitoxin system HicB family antitoxin [Streptomyces reniochalinae]